MPDTDIAQPHQYIAPPCFEEVAILHRDDHFLVVDKPSGLLSVPGRHPANRDSVIHRLQQTWPGARIVHRLDMDTSGLMVIALNADSHRALNRQFAERQVQKDYQAQVFGTVLADTGEIDLPLACDWPNRPRQMVCHETGKPALTRYRVTARRPDQTSRLTLQPHTGRSHQLRVHMAAIGHPILGCGFYAHAEARSTSSRLQLHATGLGFQHPSTREWLAYRSPCPF